MKYFFFSFSSLCTRRNTGYIQYFSMLITSSYKKRITILDSVNFLNWFRKHFVCRDRVWSSTPMIPISYVIFVTRYCCFFFWGLFLSPSDLPLHPKGKKNKKIKKQLQEQKHKIATRSPWFLQLFSTFIHPN